MLAAAALLGGGEHLIVFAAVSQLLWQIGTPDTNDLEFALAPADYAQFETDAFYVVGESDPKRDWPYVHPGPTDAWAGSRQHTFTDSVRAQKSAKCGRMPAADRPGRYAFLCASCSPDSSEWTVI